MFHSFFFDSRWRLWSWGGSLLILAATWYKVQLDVKVNEWFGGFYDSIQNALSNPGTVTSSTLLGHLWDFAEISVTFITVAVFLEFIVRHFIFRWRTAMQNYYVQYWPLVRNIEGSSQRVQEDTMRFAQIVERLGISFLRSLLTLIAFQPLLWELSKQVKVVPLLGEVDHVLIYFAFISAIIGTVLLAVVGIKLPGLEFNNQKAEAALRKELVLGEDDKSRAKPQTIAELFQDVRSNYLTMYRHYLYFDLVKQSYLQLSSIMPYVMLTPTIISGAITLGVLQQILRAFGRVEGSLHYLVYSWSSIVELISVYKRLKSFEKQITLARQQQENDNQPLQTEV